MSPDLVYGRRAVRETLRGRREVLEVLATERAVAAEPWLAETKPRLRPERDLSELAGTRDHQGVVARVEPYRYADAYELASVERPLLAVLDKVTDPRNLGAVARSVAAFGGHGILVPARRSAGVTAGAWKASAGALARIPVARAANLARALQSYRDAGVFVAGLDAAGDTPIRDLDLATAPLVLVTGSEGRGLSRIVSQACDVLVRIPIAARTESLNAGVATGIALYEVAAIRALGSRSAAPS